MDHDFAVSAQREAAGVAVALAFDRWLRLSEQVKQSPGSVPLEALDAAWRSLLEAHETWNNKR